MISIKLNNFKISNNESFTLIAGPCMLEDKNHAIKIASLINQVCKELKINYIFKSSFDKANRSSINSLRGVGIKTALNIFSEIKKRFNCPILTDVHNENQCEKLKDNNIIDILQIPAFFM